MDVYFSNRAKEHNKLNQIPFTKHKKSCCFVYKLVANNKFPLRVVSCLILNKKFSVIIKYGLFLT